MYFKPTRIRSIIMNDREHINNSRKIHHAEFNQTFDSFVRNELTSKKKFTPPNDAFICHWKSCCGSFYSLKTEKTREERGLPHKEQIPETSILADFVGGFKEAKNK